MWQFTYFQLESAWNLVPAERKKWVQLSGWITRSYAQKFSCMCLLTAMNTLSLKSACLADPIPPQRLYRRTPDKRKNPVTIVGWHWPNRWRCWPPQKQRRQQPLLIFQEAQPSVRFLSNRYSQDRHINIFNIKIKVKIWYENGAAPFRCGNRIPS